MSREATERLLTRMYREHLKVTGRLPSAKEVRAMERKAQRIAEMADNKRARQPNNT